MTARIHLADGSRDALAGDLARAGYVRGSFVFAAGEEATTYFEKYLVVTRPGLLRRAAEHLARDLPTNTDVLAARGVGSLVLASALALETGLSLLVARAGPPPAAETFAGELFPGVRVILVEDVILSGHRALESLNRLHQAGAEPVAAACLLDRERGGRLRIEATGVQVVSLFLERDLLP